MYINQLTMKLTKLFMVTAVLVLWSCQKEDVEVTDTSLIPNSSAQSETKILMGAEIPVVKAEDDKYIHGDMILYEEQFDQVGGKANPEPTNLQGKLAITGGVRKWENNTVVYVIQSGFSSTLLQMIQDSFDEWESKTAIRFKERTNESTYVTIRPNGNSCNCGSATLGSFGNRGIIQIGSRTTTYVMIHEIGHTLGYIHEQNRSDRDDYVRVLFNNIQSGAEDQFYKSTSASLFTNRMDTASTMMYGSYTFSRNGSPTIVDLNGDPLPRRSGNLSAGDIAGTNIAYPPTSGGDPDPDTDTDPDPDPDTPKDPCDGIDEWSSSVNYSVSDKVTYRGYLYQRDFSRWNFLTKCGVPDADDICAEVYNYVNGKSYDAGDKVVYNNYLYIKQSNGSWSREGRCGS